MAGKDEAGDFRKFFDSGPDAVTVSYAKAAWERLSRGKKLLFHERPGSLEAVIQAAADAGRLAGPDDVVKAVKAYYAAKATPAKAAALSEAREALRALPDDAAHALDSEPGPGPAEAPPSWVGAGIPAELWRPEFLGMKPAAVLRAVEDVAPVPAWGRAAADWVDEYGTSPETVYGRELDKGVAAGLSPEEALRLAREAGDRAAAAREAARAPQTPAAPPAGDEPAPTPHLDPVPPPTPSGPPAAALSPRELKGLEKLAGGRGEGAALLKLLQEQGAVAGPGALPPAPPAEPAAPETEPPLAIPLPEASPPGPAPAPWDEFTGLVEAAEEAEAEEEESPLAPLTTPPRRERKSREAAQGPLDELEPGWFLRTADRFVNEVLGPGETPDRPPLSRAPRGGSYGPLDELEPGWALSAGGRLLDEVLGPGDDWGEGRAGFGGGTGGGEGAGGAGMMEVLVRIAEGVERLIEVVGEMADNGGGADGPGHVGGVRDYGWEGGEEDETPASPSVDLAGLPQPGKTRDAYGHPRPQSPKRQSPAGEH